MAPTKPKNFCFGCGPDNSEGLHLQFSYDPNKHQVETTVKLPARYQGAAGFAHGGIIATLLDEAMAKVNGREGIRAMTVKLETHFRKVVPIHELLRLVGWRTSKRGRRIYLRSAIYDRKNHLLAEANGLFVEVKTHSQ